MLSISIYCHYVKNQLLQNGDLMSREYPAETQKNGFDTRGKRLHDHEMFVLGLPPVLLCLFYYEVRSILFII